MKRITLLLLLLITTDFAFAQLSRAKFAQNYVKEKTGKKISFSVTKKFNNCMFLKNDTYHSFVVIANEEFDSILSNPILVYSTESTGSFRDMSNADAKIIATYDSFLEKIKKQKNWKDNTDVATTSVEKLLGPIHLSQQRVDLGIFGMAGEVVVAGCVPTAAMQVMLSYKWPEVITGKHLYYTERDGYKLINLDGKKLVWPDDETIESKGFGIPKVFVGFNGMLFDVSFGEKGTSGNMNLVKRSLVNYYGFSRKMNLVFDITGEKLIRLLRNELDASRPLILANWQHAFVCDGYRDEFFHLNMGWGGYFNGNFRIFPNMEFDVIYGIMPERQTSFTERTITLTKAGTLKDSINTEDYDHMGTLKIEGPLNGADIKLIRELSGAVSLDTPIEKRGILMNLDLSKATITESKVVYYNTDEYKQSHAEWEKKHTWRNCYTEEIVPDKKYVDHYFTNANEIGSHMFKGCNNLKSIILPDNTKCINSHAFRACTSLKEITIPTSVSSLSHSLFVACTQLEKVRIPKENTKYEEEHLKKDSPKSWFRYAYPLVDVEKY